MVDPIERRQALAEAVWRVIRRDGIQGASVREVAQEAGLSTGSLRHYFTSQSALLTFAMAMVIERVEERVRELPRPQDPLEAARVVLAELLPLDPERQAENQVWLAFTARALVDPALRRLRDEAYDRLRAACHGWVVQLLSPQAAASQVEVETDRLFALLDGLAVHAAMRPGPTTHLVAALHHHLSEIADGSPGR